MLLPTYCTEITNRIFFIEPFKISNYDLLILIYYKLAVDSIIIIETSILYVGMLKYI